MLLILLLLLLMIWQSPGLPGWRKVNFITVTHRPHHPNIAAGSYCLATSPGFLPTLCEKWSGFFYVHRVFLSYTRDRRLKVSSERLGNEDKAPCPRALLPGRGSNRGLPVATTAPFWSKNKPVSRSLILQIKFLFHFMGIMSSNFFMIQHHQLLCKLSLSRPIALEQWYPLDTEKFMNDFCMQFTNLCNCSFCHFNTLQNHCFLTLMEYM